MRLTDLFSVANDLDLSNTETSNLAFANLSAVFGLGAEARKWLAGRIFRELPELTRLMIAEKPAQLSEEVIYSTCLRRLRVLRDLTADQGSKLILVIPPTRGSGAESTYAAVQRAGSSEGVAVLVPLQPNSLQVEYYSDKTFHLNERGAAIFTPMFADAIRKRARICLQGKARPSRAA